MSREPDLRGEWPAKSINRLLRTRALNGLERSDISLRALRRVQQVPK